MARSKRIKETAAGVAFYHVTSRANNRQFLFSSPKTKDALVDALKRAAAFSGVGLEAYAIMDNHVHVVARVTRPECSIAAMGTVPNDACDRSSIESGENIASGLGHLFPAKRVVARAVGEIGFSTHGLKLAKADDARRAKEVA